MLLNITKVNNGLISKVNPLLESKLTDFLGSGTFFRDDITFTVTGGYIERNFLQTNYVILINKNNDELLEGEEYGVYVRTSGRRSGIIEKSNKKTSTHWKIISFDGYIQTYLSYDNMNEWTSSGGGIIDKNTDTQGFFTTNSTLKILDYKIYSSPYVSFLNIPFNSIVRIYDENNDIIKEKMVTDNGVCEIWLDKPLKNVFFTVNNYTDESLLFKSELIDINLGDVYDNIDYELEVSYNGIKLNNFDNTHILKFDANIKVKNISNSIYNNILVTTELINGNTDDIKLSLDGVDFYQSITINEISPNEIVDVYIKMTKDTSVSNFGNKFFDLVFR